MRKLSLCLLMAAAVAFTACTDDTSVIGIDTMPNADIVSSDTASFRFDSRTIEVDSVLANSHVCYLGRVVDPETRAMTKADFLAQFHVMEDTKFPTLDRIVKDAEGRPVADSVEIRLYFDAYYGDSLASMKLRVAELDTARVMEEGVKTYSNFNPADFLNPHADAERKELTYAVKDLTRPDHETDGSTYYRNVQVKLSPEYGSRILRKYYENPAFFESSYQFVHHVCPGFYFESAGGTGSMIQSSLMSLNLFFRYHTTTTAGTDTIVEGMQRMGGTEEVIQNTTVANRVTAEMLDASQGYTYLKSPASLFTELTLPVAEIVDGKGALEHLNDSINQAKLTIGAYNTTSGNQYALQPPTEVVLLRKADMFAFFERETLPDNVTSFLTSYASATQAYEFSNLANLVNTMRRDRDKGAGVLASDSPAARAAKYAVWEAKAENADWNKAVLVPVKAEYRTTTSALGTSSKELVRVKNAFGLSSVKLRGGDNGALKMSVIYSKFNR